LRPAAIGPLRSIAAGLDSQCRFKSGNLLSWQTAEFGQKRSHLHLHHKGNETQHLINKHYRKQKFMNTYLELSTLLIRQAVAEDEAAVRDCAEQAYVRYIGLIGRKPAPMTADFGMQISAGQVHSAFDRQGVFLGFIVFYPDERGMHIENVAVLPSAAGQGVGRALVRYCERQACYQDVEVVHLYTNEKMAENLKIYSRLGYIEIARRMEDGFHRVFFEKKIR
jgi:ribosomal protein S18 acetylase RimI-like enzyme